MLFSSVLFEICPFKPRLVLMAAQWQAAVEIWRAATRAARDASHFWAYLPSDCKHAAVFTASTCAGFSPAKYVPGLGPLSLAWGWLLIGVLLGLCFWDLAHAVESLVARMGQLRDHYRVARGQARRPLWHPAAAAALAMAGNGPERVFLQRLVDDGDAALQMLALCTGVAPREALARVLGREFVATHAASWGL